MIRRIRAYAMAIATSTIVHGAPAAPPATRPAYVAHAGNPILPGYYADPSIVQAGGHAYIYATLDPWGGRTLGCWESADWHDWTYRTLNWPTKEACTSTTSKDAMVWAPSVLRGVDGKFHMAVSVGNEVWAGVADGPLGPWTNPLGDGHPWIGHDFRPGYHMIDAELFLDTDGQAYLYWGSGFNWVNGKCWAVKLKPDMLTFDGDVRDVTPAHYFEAPFMVKHGGRYYLMYSAGKTTEDTYQVRYATGDSPFGPFTESDSSPILTTNVANDIISPGHHAVFEKDGQAYILYHRHSVPFDPKFVGRQTCVDELHFDADGKIQKVVPTHAGPALVQGPAGDRHPLSAGAVFTASGQADADHGPACVGDDNYATRWAAPAGGDAWLKMDLSAVRDVTRQEVRPEFAWQPLRFTLLASTDGQAWTTLATGPAAGSPIVISTPCRARYLKLIFPADSYGRPASIWEWTAE